MSRKNLSHTLSAPFVRHHEFNSLSLQQKSDIKNIYHMKKLHLILMAALVAIAATAAPLSPQEALNRLKESNENAGAKTHSITINPTLSRTFTTSQGEPAIYAFTNPDGSTIFVGGDDVAKPLIGYTNGSESDLQAMPPAMQTWLDGLAKDIENAAKNTTRRMPLTTSASYDKGKAVAPLITTAWGQGEPYNNLCPEYKGGTSLTGCGATAMAQVMNHFQCPKEYGYGSITYHPITWDNDETLSMDFSATRFDWASMKDTYAPGEYTEAEGKAVAELMKACGYAVEMKYSPDGSESDINIIATALAEHFGYSANSTFKMRNYCTTEEWYRLHYESLEAGSPIIYRAEAANGGHLFICDGSDGNGYFHFNWGWNGHQDSYFLLNAINPDYAAGGYENSYSNGQIAIFNIHPAVEGEAYKPLALSLTDAIRLSIDGNTLKISGEYGGLLTNLNAIPTYTSIAAELQPVDTQGAEAGIPHYMTITDGISFAFSNGYNHVELPVAWMADIPAGTYQLRMVSMDLSANQPTWTRAEHNDYTPDYAYIMKDADGTVSVSQVATYNDLNFKAFKALTPLKYSKPVKLYAEVENTGDKTISIDMVPLIINPATPGGETGTVSTVAETHVRLTLEPGEVKQYEWTTRFNSNIEISEPQAVTLAVIDGAFDNLIETTKMETTLYPQGKPKVNGFRIEDCAMRDGKYIVTNPEEIRFTADIECEDYAYSEQVYLYTYLNDPSNFMYGAAPIVFAEPEKPHKLSGTLTVPSSSEGLTFRTFLAKQVNGKLLPLYSDLDNLSPDLSIKFVIDTQTGAGSVAAISGEQPFTICNAQGMTIKANATRADLDALPQGLYIIKQGDKAAAYRR